MSLQKLASETYVCFLHCYRAERRAYYRNCLKAEVSPKQYLSLIVDGMDQSKQNLPHANCLSKVSLVMCYLLVSLLNEVVESLAKACMSCHREGLLMIMIAIDTLFNICLYFVSFSRTKPTTF